MDWNLHQERIGALRRYLETDSLLGIRYVPLAMKRPTGARSAAVSGSGSVSRSATVSAPQPAPAATRPATPPIPDQQAVQQLAPNERARREKALKELESCRVKNCTLCGLHATRTNTVFGQGNAGARVVFVGEGPGADEDAQGLAFVGRAGQLLTKMIEAMGLSRKQVYICNVVKCRPPDNRVPAPDEMSACWPVLDEQLRIIQPEVIVALGKTACTTLLRNTSNMGTLRGNWHDYYTSGKPGEGTPTPLMPTYHPAYLLRNPPDKGKVWSDLKAVLHKLALPVPP